MLLVGVAIHVAAVCMRRSYQPAKATDRLERNCPQMGTSSPSLLRKRNSSLKGCARTNDGLQQQQQTTNPSPSSLRLDNNLLCAGLRARSNSCRACRCCAQGPRSSLRLRVEIFPQASVRMCAFICCRSLRHSEASAALYIHDHGKKQPNLDGGVASGQAEPRSPGSVERRSLDGASTWPAPAFPHKPPCTSPKLSAAHALDERSHGLCAAPSLLDLKRQCE